MNYSTLMQDAKARNASDLHLVADYPPLVRVDGELIPLSDDILSKKVVTQFLAEILPERLQKSFEEQRSSDFGLVIGDSWRARCNAYHSNGQPALAFRLIPNKLFTLNELGAPAVVEEIAKLSHGLVLVTGPTGSGKSSTLATIINHIGANRRAHIVAIENPIEFIHARQKSLVTQREVGADTPTFATGLCDCLREDPNIILVGEVRDHETMALALRAAETGHLVFTTLHTGTAAQAIDRFVDAFPGAEKETVRSILANTLRAVISQTLLKRKNGGRVAAFEILLSTPAIHNLIRENRSDQIISAIQTGSRAGMQTLKSAVERLGKEGIISKATVQEALGSGAGA